MRTGVKPGKIGLCRQVAGEGIWGVPVQADLADWVGAPDPVADLVHGHPRFGF